MAFGFFHWFRRARSLHLQLPILAFLATWSVSTLGQEFQLTYDLNQEPGATVDAPNVRAYGKSANDNFGRVIRAGDINGDGIHDLIVGTPGADAGSPVRVDAGAVYVWFGKDTVAGTKDVAGTSGTPPDLTILGASNDDQLTRDGALLVKDIDGDGVADLLLGALLADGPNDQRTSAGEAYIIFGKQAEESFPAVLDLRNGGADVIIYGASNDDQLTFGGAMAVGDVTGDGVNDVLFGSVLADGPANSRTSAGEAYIVKGRAGAWPASLDLSIQGSGGADVTIYGASGNDFLTFGGAIRVGDVNEDGIVDVILGARDADGPNDSRSSCGEAYLVFGRSELPATLDLAVQGSGGADVTLYGASPQDQLTSGGTLAVGDVNGDGYADLLIGAAGGDGAGDTRPSAGEAYIISGRQVFPLTLDLAILGPAGASATIYGANAQDQLTSGGSLAVGDVNGDGFTDLLLGAPLADGPAESRTSAGEAYIVLGGASFPSVMDLNPETEGDHADVTIYGASVDDNLTIEGALTVGDVDGDGAEDLLLGARLADGPGEERNNAGEAYVVLGRNPFPPTIDLATKGIGGADVTLYGATGGVLTAAQDQLTSSAALSAGDVDGDGFADVIVGAIAADGPSETRMSSGELYVIFGTGSLAMAPDIAVEQPAGTNIPDGGSRFGSILIGGHTTRTFTIRNSGLEVLTDLALSKEGAHEGDYEIGDLPATILAPGASLTFDVTFTPSAVGSRSAILRIASNDPNENPFEIVMTGNGAAPEIDVEQPAGSSLLRGATHSMGAVHTGGESVHTFIIRNTGAAELTQLAILNEGPNAEEFTVGALGATTVAGNSFTSFTVTFAPTDLGPRTTTLSIASNDVDENPFLITLSGTGKLPAPEIRVEQPAGTERMDQDTIPVGAVPVGLERVLGFTIKNTGSATLTGLAVSKSGTHEGEYLVGAFGTSTLAPGSSTTLQVTFVPAGAGLRAAQLEIVSNDEDENPFRLTLSGIGVDPEIVLEEPAGVDLENGGSRAFGDVLVGQALTKTVLIRNIGTTDLTDFEVTKSGAAAADFVVGVLGAASVAPGESTTVNITFAPTARGLRSAVIHLANNDANENPFNILVTGNGRAPEIVVEGPGGTDLPDGGTPVELAGTVIETTGAAQTFTIRNEGNSDLTGLQLALNGTDSASFTVGSLSATTLAAGESATFTVTFAPLVAGDRTAVIQISSSDGDESIFDIALKAPAYPKEPVFQPQTLRRWVVLGEAATWTPFVSGSDPKTYQWYKGTLKVPGAAGMAATLNLPKVKATDAAIYTLRAANAFAASPVTSPDFYLGVVSRAPASVILKEGATLSLTCTATVPAGAGMSYRWKRDDTPLTESLTVTGTQGKNLKILKVTPADAGVYTCEVNMIVEAVPLAGDGGSTQVVVAQKPVIEPFTLATAYVGEQINFQIPTSNDPTAFSISGLPSGVVVSKTGVLTGAPKTAKVLRGNVVPYALKVSASNLAGKSAVEPVDWTILPLEPNAVGTFDGLVDRHSELNAGLGGNIRVVTTATGAFSGTLKLGAQILRLTGSLVTPKGGGNPSGTSVVKRRAPLSPLTITWTADLGTNRMTGTIEDEGGESVAFTAWRTPWSNLNKATGYAYSHTAALTPETGTSTAASPVPQGEGYAMVRIALTGAATWSGKLADGTALTGATTLGPDGQLALQVMLYRNTGSVQGWSAIDPTGLWDSTGVIDWYKEEQVVRSTTRSYKAGIAQHGLVLTGGRYVKPAGTVLDLPAAPPANAQLSFAGGALDTGFDQAFTITDKNAVQMPKVGEENPKGVRVTVAAATGIISGSFALADPDPLDVTEPIAVLKRTATFSGVLVPRLGRGAGYFLLQRLPEVPGETVAKTPILSGGMSLGPVLATPY